METVTISLETYESMKEQIKTLSAEVKKREIVRIEKEPVEYSKVAFVAIVCILWAFMLYSTLVFS